MEGKVGTIQYKRGSAKNAPPNVVFPMMEVGGEMLDGLTDGVMAILKWTMVAAGIGAIIYVLKAIT